MGDLIFDALFRAGIRVLAKLIGCELERNPFLGGLLIALVVFLVVCVVVLVILYLRAPKRGTHRKAG